MQRLVIAAVCITGILPFERIRYNGEWLGDSQQNAGSTPVKKIYLKQYFQGIGINHNFRR